MRRVPIDRTERQASVAMSPCRRLTRATRSVSGAGRTFASRHSKVASEPAGSALTRAVVPAIQIDPMAGAATTAAGACRHGSGQC